jgi:hypothetical protein
MDAAQQARSEEKQKLLVRLAELMIEQQVEEGVFLGTPHYSIIELAAANLGRELSREAQQRAAREIAAGYEQKADCPTCHSSCDVRSERRQVTSVSGPIDLTETVADCPKCRRSFFPSTCGDGIG